jgi:L-threonylcarbamoyladenylate synthase
MADVSLTNWIHAVEQGDLVSFPTDTVPALAARPEAGDRIYQFKRRSATKPLILMGATLADLRPYISGSDTDLAQWQQIAERHWPGALTLVLPASDRLPPAMNPQGTGTIGLRVPNHPLARYLLARTGPLATTSVNHSGQPPLETMAAIARQFPELLTLSGAALGAIYQDWQSEPPPPEQTQGSGQPSTVVQWVDNQWQVLRQGAIHL